MTGLFANEMKISVFSQSLLSLPSQMLLKWTQGPKSNCRRKSIHCCHSSGSVFCKYLGIGRDLKKLDLTSLVKWRKCFINILQFNFAFMGRPRRFSMRNLNNSFIDCKTSLIPFLSNLREQYQTV